jgi:hypothetical protein
MAAGIFISVQEEITVDVSYMTEATRLHKSHWDN